MRNAVLICVVIALALVLGCGGHAPTAAATAKDPVCKMDVEPARSLKAEHGGKTYYFCSENCKERFEKEPAKFAQAK